MYVSNNSIIAALWYVYCCDISGNSVVAAYIEDDNSIVAIYREDYFIVVKMLILLLQLGFKL